MHISVIDDEKILTSRIVKKLGNNGYAVSGFTSYHDFTKNGDPLSDLYIIDISLGDGSGFDIIKNLRKKGCVAPIIILSGYGESDKIIYGLNIGADDYMTKPFIPEELLARIHALLRRPQVIRAEDTLYHKDIKLDPNTGKIEIANKNVYLTKKEFLILEILLRQAEKVVSRSEIIEKVWGSRNELDVSDNTINATLSKMRKKLGDSFVLETIYNQGYILK